MSANWSIFDIKIKNCSACNDAFSRAMMMKYQRAA